MSGERTMHSAFDKTDDWERRQEEQRGRSIAGTSNPVKSAPPRLPVLSVDDNVVLQATTRTTAVTPWQAVVTRWILDYDAYLCATGAVPGVPPEYVTGLIGSYDPQTKAFSDRERIVEEAPQASTGLKEELAASRELANATLERVAKVGADLREIRSLMNDAAQAGAVVGSAITVSWADWVKIVGKVEQALK